MLNTWSIKKRYEHHFRVNFYLNHYFLIFDTFWLICFKCCFYRTITKFNFLRRDGIHVQQTEIKYVPGDPKTAYISMRWSPANSDIGKHIICANAEDNKGYHETFPYNFNDNNIHVLKTQKAKITILMIIFLCVTN